MAAYFSLILPCYNVAAYVERCVHSILCQSFTDYEIILVDDGSTDQTPAICDALASAHGCIRVVHKANGGLSSARNAGLEIAAGTYIWFVDSDDWIEPEALTVLRQACGDGNPEMIKFTHYRAALQKKLVPGMVPPGCYEGEAQIGQLRSSALCAAGRYVLSAWSHVYRRSFLSQYGLAFVSERVICSEDYLFNLQALLYVKRLTVLDVPLYSYELRAGSLTQTYKPDLAKRYTELYRQLTACYQAAGVQERTQRLIDRFYVWHLIVGTCFHHEYRAHAGRDTLPEGRSRVRQMMCIPEVCRAARRSDRTGLSWQKRLQLLALQLHLEPLFCWLFVVKPGKKR